MLRMSRVRSATHALTLAVLLGAWLAAPAATQQSQSRSVSEWVHGGRSVRVEALGTIEFTPDDRDVARISPGGRLVVEERRRGGPTFRVVYTPAGSGIDRSVTVDGRRGDTGAGEAWLHAILPEVIRESGIGAEARVARLLAERGVEATLREVEQLRNESVRRIYFTHLLRHPGLYAAGAARALASVGRTIDSDGDKAVLLRETRAAVNLEDTRVRAAYLGAVESIGSDGDRAATLRALLGDGRRRGAATWIAWLRSAQTIRSDGDKAMVLVQFARTHPLHDEAVRGAFLNAAGSIASAGDLHHVLRTVLRGAGTDAGTAADVIARARAIRSDGDKASLLLAVEPRLLTSLDVRTAYDATARTIGSEGDRTAALAHLLRHTSLMQEPHPPR